jgi:hypothetical protein
MTHKPYRFKGTVFEFATLAASIVAHMSQHGLIEPSPYATVTTADGREFDIDQESESTAIAAMGGFPLKLHGENWHEFIPRSNYE